MKRNVLNFWSVRAAQGGWICLKTSFKRMVYLRQEGREGTGTLYVAQLMLQQTLFPHHQSSAFFCAGENMRSMENLPSAQHLSSSLGKLFP